MKCQHSRIITCCYVLRVTGGRKNTHPTQDSQPAHSQDAAMKSLLEGRKDLAETRLAVTATQIIERLKIRASHLKQLMAEELEVDTRLLRLQDAGLSNSLDMMGLESKLTQGLSQLRSAKRREDTECWRDLASVMRDFLNAWEGFSKNEAKNRFLAALPDSSKNNTPSMPKRMNNYDNDYSNHNYSNQR